MEEIKTVLPLNATPLEIALDKAAGVRIKNIPAREVSRVFDPATCPAAVLPWLAWSFRVEDWDSSWDEQRKREAISSAVEKNRIKGTIGAIRKAVELLGYDVLFNENPNGVPYTFETLIDANSGLIDEASLEKIDAAISRNKNVRSHQTRFVVFAQGDIFLNPLIVEIDAETTTIFPPLPETDYNFQASALGSANCETLSFDFSPTTLTNKNNGK